MSRYELTDKELKWLCASPFGLCLFVKQPIEGMSCKYCRWWDDLMETCAVRTMDHDWQDVAEFEARVARKLAGGPDIEADAEAIVFSKEGDSLGFSFELLKLARLEVEKEMDRADV